MICYAIIVSYNPDINELNKLIKTIIDQDFNLVLIDNSEINISKSLISHQNCHAIYNNHNMGIAYAQNIGIMYAISHKAEIITFLDQDSIIQTDLLNKLVQPLLVNKYCVTAPISINKANNTEYPSHIINKYGWTKDVYAKNTSSLFPVDLVISSGLTTSTEVLNIVGHFDEDFFIDFVDIEWCIRCKKRHIPIFLVPNTFLEHSIGNKMISKGFFKCIVHSPIRTYYKVRNSFLLLSKKVGLLFSFRQILPAIFQNFIMIFFIKNKKEYYKYYFKGIIHGITNKKGKYK